MNEAAAAVDTTDDPDKTKAFIPDVVESEVVNAIDDNKDKNDKELSPREAIYKKHDEQNRKFSEGADDEDDGTADYDEPEMVTVKVNGKERQVEKSKVDAEGGVDVYQKRLAAEEILREAAENRKVVNNEITRLREREEAFAERERLFKEKESALSKLDAQTQQNHDLPDKNGDQHQDLTDKARAVREAIFSGDEDGADKALLALLETAKTHSTGTDDDLSTLSQRAAEEAVALMESKSDQANLRSAYQQFQKDYPDIDTSPRLRDMADRETQIIRDEHPDWGYSQIMKEAGKRVTEYLAWQSRDNDEENSSINDGKGSDGKDEDGTRRKIDEKRKIQTPRASTGRQKPDTGLKKETNSEYIVRLRKERGLE